MTWILLAIAVVMVARSPLGLALAERIRYGPGGAPGRSRDLEELAQRVTQELADLRAQLVELGERLDVTEQALLHLRRPDLLPGHQAGPPAADG